MTRRRRDTIAGAALFALFLAIAGAALIGAAYLDCQHARIAGQLRYCPVFNGRR
jgi:hypothetical protein